MADVGRRPGEARAAHGEEEFEGEGQAVEHGGWVEGGGVGGGCFGDGVAEAGRAEEVEGEVGLGGGAAVWGDGVVGGVVVGVVDGWWCGDISVFMTRGVVIFHSSRDMTHPVKGDEEYIDDSAPSVEPHEGQLIGQAD